ncbi:hypothetical protein JCM8547_008462 [Rhodosporidiobolus lusitaniae]
MSFRRNLVVGDGADAATQAAMAMIFGRPLAVTTNAYNVTPPSNVCYHYEVKIVVTNKKRDDTATPPRLNREIWKYLAEEMQIFGDTAVCFDERSMAYSPRKLPAGEGSWSVVHPEEDGATTSKRDFAITIKFTRPIDLGRLGVFVRGDRIGQPDQPDASEVQSAIQALNVLIQHGPSIPYPHRAASFFLPPANPAQASITRGITCWRDFYTSLRLGPGRLFLSLDTASQPMVQAGTLPDVILAFLRGDRRSTSYNDMAALNIPSPTKKVKTVEGWPANSTKPEHMFEANGQTHTNESYFRITHNVRLQHPDWPVVAVSKIARWPIELCEVEAGQKYTKKLDPDQTADSIRLTTIAPRERRQTLVAGLEYIQPPNKALKQWDVEITKEPIEVKARELPPPMIVYSKQVRPHNGVWDIKGQQFHKAARIERWLIIVFDSSQFFSVFDAQTCVLGLIGACTSLGMHIGQQRPKINYAPRGVDIPSYITRLGGALVEKEGGPPDMVVCFLPRKPCGAYGEIKRFGDVDMGVSTQCVFINKAKKGNRQYFENVALKMNHKLANGTNSVLCPEDLGILNEKPTMLIGADISHAMPNSLNPSVAAIVGSMDQRATVYGSAMSVQHSRLEIIANLEKMVIRLLTQFTKRHNQPPARIIFLRDGISESQFSQVIATEVEACRMAAKRFGDMHKQIYEPCRHHISFFPKNRDDDDHKTGNVRSGTVIDTEVTSTFHFDWYTQAHASVLGTGRSAHYTVLIDDVKFSADQLQTLIFNLCFTYARATRAVSVATPAFYASRLCTRAQLLLKREDDDSATVMSSTSGSSQEHLRSQALAEYSSRLKEIHEFQDDKLFWM